MPKLMCIYAYILVSRMSDNDDEPNADFGPSPEVPDWDNYRVVNEEADATPPLQASDYLALFVASLQTIFLPIILLLFVMVVLAMIINFVLV
jgi:hypothetical protein